jgi:hypothetical protein
MTEVVSHWAFMIETWVLSLAVRVGFVANRLALSQVFLLVLQFSPCIIIPLVLCTHLFIYH